MRENNVCSVNLSAIPQKVQQIAVFHILSDKNWMISTSSAAADETQHIFMLADTYDQCDLGQKFHFCLAATWF